MSDARRMVALHRYRVLRPHLDEEVPLTQAANAAGVPRRTAQRWLTHYRRLGVAGLAPPERADKGRRRIPAELALLIEGLALRRPAPAAAVVYRQAVEVAVRQGWLVPSYATVYDIVRHLDPALATLAFDGTKRYQEVFDLVYRREAERSNDIWQADHTELDLWVLDPAGNRPGPG